MGEAAGTLGDASSRDGPSPEEGVGSREDAIVGTAAGESTACSATDGFNDPQAERAIVERAASGEVSAFETLVLRYQDRVYGLALRLTRRPEEAEDVTQEAFLKAYRGLPAFGGRSSFYTWLFRITFNAACSRTRAFGRRNAREKVVPMGVAADSGDGAAPNPVLADPPSRHPGPAESVETADAAQRVRLAIDELEPDHRAVVVLRDVEGLSYEEIAEVVGVSRAAVKSRLHRARGVLASKLKDLLS